jgi:VanZ family protein
MPALLLCAAIYIQSAHPVPEAVPGFFFSDKLLHAMVYGVLAALFCRGFNSLARFAGRRGAVFISAVAAATLYGLSDEWHQLHVVERSADWADLIADFIGAVIGGTIYVRLRRSQRFPLSRADRADP